MLHKQDSLPLSAYSTLYDIVVPKDNLLRQMKEVVDFSFVYHELKEKYCLTNGRTAIDPIRLFKYLLLKVIYDLSDVDVVERSRYDLSFKYFLDMTPEEDVIHPSSLTKFRKIRLKDIALLDLLIQKSVEIAMEHKLIKSNAIIVDSTHTQSRYNQKSPKEYLVELSKKLRHQVYLIDPTMKDLMPEKNPQNNLEQELVYVQSVIDTIEKNPTLSTFPAVKTQLNLLKEVIEDDLEQIQSVHDKEARVGHKTADSNYFGYKTHIAITKERIMVAATVTTGEKHDGKQLKELVEKSKENGMEVEAIIGDAAYSEKENIEYANSQEISLISRLSKTVTHGNRKNAEKFEFNKDAGMYVCKAGHMSYKKTSTRAKKHEEDGQGTVESYWFKVEKCKECPLRDGCYKEGSKTKSYSVSIKSNTHQGQADFQETEEFKSESKYRYIVEAKNSELKGRHGYDRATSSGLFGMEMQAATTIFGVNLKRIIKLLNEKENKKETE